MSEPATARQAIPRTVWMLGLVSLCTDMSSEWIHALLPLFLVGSLGASALVVGAIEGVAEALALAVKLVSGALSDRLGRRKPLVVFGYGLAALTKPMFPLAGSVGMVAAARLLDRLGKGIRGAPRDALIADVTPADVRGAAYGLRQSMDTLGAVLGPLLAMLCMLWFLGDIRAALWAAVVPAVIAVLILVFGVAEPQHAAPVRVRPWPLTRAAIGALDARFWRLVALGTLLATARFTEAFLVLRAASVGIAETWVPLVMVAMALVYSLSAWPAGRLSDRLGRSGLLQAGIVVLLAAHGLLALAGDAATLFGGVLLFGLHLGLTQGVLSSLVADLVPAERRGTAFGVFSLASGLGLLVGSVGAGLMADALGYGAPFAAGAGLALLALALLPMLAPRRR